MDYMETVTFSEISSINLLLILILIILKLTLLSKMIHFLGVDVNITDNNNTADV